ncbi:MAG TPA: arginine repressor [Terriglobales bacterium]|nr:arginine repressor [Terriglobales bacterium]
MSKLARQNRILELVQQEPLANQDELRLRLSRLGFKVTQATLSRDIHDLGLVKTPEGYMAPPGETLADAGAPRIARLLREFVLRVREAQNLLVVKTTPGSAQPVAAGLDAEDWPEIVGTVGGDDTILVICPDRKSARRLLSRLEELLA